MPILPELETSDHERAILKAKCAAIVAANPKTMGIDEGYPDEAIIVTEYADRMLTLLRDIDRLIGAVLTIEP